MMHTGTAMPIPIAAPVERPLSLYAVRESEPAADVPEESVWLLVLEGLLAVLAVEEVAPQS